MIKSLLAFGLACCAAAAPAQFIITSPGGAPNSGGSAFGGVLPPVQPIGGGLYLGTDVTPTMQRERRDEMTRVRNFIAAAPEKWTSSNPRVARRLYRKAAHEAKWARIESHRGAM